MFCPIPKNKKLPYDIYMKKAITISEGSEVETLKERRFLYTFFAPSIIFHSGYIPSYGYQDFQTLISRKYKVNETFFIDINVESNSYLVEKDRIAYLYYVEKEKVCDFSFWKKGKTISGKDYSPIQDAFPKQIVWTKESFCITVSDETPYYIIAQINDNKNQLNPFPTEGEKVDLDRLNESYYWSILDMENSFSKKQENAIEFA